MHPVGPLNSRIYWLRRVIVIAAAVLVLIGVGFLVIQKTKKNTSTPSNAAVAVSDSRTPTLTGVLAPNSVGDSVAMSPAPSSAPASSPPVASPPPVTTTVTRTSTAGSTPTRVSGAAATSPPVKAVPAATTPKTPAKTVPAKTPPVATTPVKTAPAKATPTTAPATTAPATTPIKVAPPTSAKPTSTAPPPPSTDAQGRLLCADASLKLVASTGSPAFAVGDQPTLGVSVTNVSAVPCTRDLSGGLQVFSVYSKAGARIWSTADCFPGTGSDIRTLAAGQVLQYTIKWSGTTSNPGCTAARVQVPSGQYQVRVQIGSLRAAPAAFTIN